MKAKKPRIAPRIVVAVVLLLAAAALWMFLFYPNLRFKELPAQAAQSEALDYSSNHGGIYQNREVYVLASERSDDSDIFTLAGRLGAEAEEVGERVFRLRFGDARSPSELDGIILWLEESPEVEAAYLSTLTRSAFSTTSGSDAYATDVPWLESLRALWRSDRLAVAGAGYLAVALAICVPTVLACLRSRRRKGEE